MAGTSRAGSELESICLHKFNLFSMKNTSIEAFSPNCPKEEHHARKEYSLVKTDVCNQLQMRLRNQDSRVTMKDRDELWPC